MLINPEQLHLLCIEELVERYKQAPRDEGSVILAELLLRYQPLIKTYYRRFYNLELEREDFFQEMSICLWAALQTFKPERGAPFGSYLSIRLYHRCLDLFRFHHHPRRYISGGVSSLDTPVGEGLVLEDMVSSHYTYNPDQVFMVQEELRHFYGALSHYEAHVLDAYIHSQSLETIASHLHKPRASVRSAYYRAHQKLKEQLFLEEDSAG
ncbi:MAG: sigma-70 family RNA polymerase sigma factor [Aerococcus sp.]|nr:sigma-70 family RNA polymerase sigma factor [Aerococcus sp.]